MVVAPIDFKIIYWPWPDRKDDINGRQVDVFEFQFLSLSHSSVEDFKVIHFSTLPGNCSSFSEMTT